MTRKETLQILSLLRASYPAFYSKFQKSELEAIANLWTEMFIDDDFNITKYALKELIATHNGYPPDIAALKTKIKDIVSVANDKPTHEELWQILKRAASNGFYGAETEFQKLPPILKRYVGSPSTLKEYSMIDADTFNTVNHGQFLKQISIIEEREEQNAKMPSEVKLLISSITNGLEEQKRLTEGEFNERRNLLLDSL